MFNLNNENWLKILSSEFSKNYFIELKDFLNMQYKEKNIYPPKELVFNSLNKTDFYNVKVVIIGQDPYHNNGQANGLSFSVNDNVKIPRSLSNIFKEINQSIGCKNTNSGNLSSWATQGVLLLNTVLTVEENKPNSHKNIGWERITHKIISEISEKRNHVVFMLWGKKAESLKTIISKNHLVLVSSHPSPFSANKGFFGCNHFQRANNYLVENNKIPINWCL